MGGQQKEKASGQLCFMCFHWLITAECPELQTAPVCCSSCSGRFNAFSSNSKCARYYYRNTVYGTKLQQSRDVFCKDLLLYFFCLLYTSCQWNSNTIMLSSGEETLYVEIQNWCMLNLQASSLELWMHTTTVQRNAHSPGISPGGPWSFPNFGVKWSILAVGDSLVENSLFT